MVRMDPKLRRKVKALLFGINELRRESQGARQRRIDAGTPILEDTYDYADNNRKRAALIEELWDVVQQFDGQGLVPGRSVEFDTHEDARSIYIVGNIGEKTSEVFYFPVDDGDLSDAVCDGRVFTKTIREKCEYEDKWTKRVEDAGRTGAK